MKLDNFDVERMRIQEVFVKGLFNLFDHRIRFNESGMVIIIGDNGIGKTTLLKILHNLFSKEFEYFFSIVFEEIVITFSDAIWHITCDNDILTIRSEGEEKEFYHRKRDYVGIKPLQRNFVRIDEDLWMHRSTGKYYSSEGLHRRYGLIFQPNENSWPGWFKKKQEEIKIRFIQTQRLFDIKNESDRNSGQMIYKIKKYSEDLVNLLKHDNSLFTAKSVKLDRTFVVRLLNMLEPDEQQEDVNLRRSIDDLNDYVKLLSDTGIIDKEYDLTLNNAGMNFSDMEDSIKNVIDLYFKDNLEKLMVFQPTADKLQILLNIISERFKHKRLLIDRNRGFVIKSVFEDKEIPIDCLSSGEQNELIIFYTLLFNTDANDIVLIDEPEISLHIAWQHRLIADLRKIADNTGVSIVISTHSPDIIGSNWDIVQKLTGPEDKRED